MLFRKIVLCLGLLVALSGGVSAQVPAPAPASEKTGAESTVASIPFRTEPQSFTEQSLTAFFMTLALLGVTVIGLYYLRNHLQKKGGPSFLKPTSIQLKERVRLSPQLTMYVVTYRNKEILLAQSGNAVTAVSEAILHPASPSPVQNQNQPE